MASASRPGHRSPPAQRTRAMRWKRLNRARSAANIGSAGVKLAAAPKPRRGNVESFQSTTSWGSKEQFYRNQWKKHNKSQLGEIPSKRIAAQRSAPSLSAGVRDWTAKLRKCKSTSHLHKSGQKKLPKRAHQLSKPESTLWEQRAEAWKKSRGNNTSAHSKVTEQEFKHQFPSFRYTVRGRSHLTANDLARVAKQLNVPTRGPEVKKATDVLDQDSSGKVQFHEMINSLRKLKRDDTQPFVGGKNGLPVDLLLMHFHRRSLLDHATKAVTNDMQHRMYLTARHSFQHHSRRAPSCKVCMSDFNTTPELEEHMREKHEYKDKTGETTHFTCRQCGHQRIPLSRKQNHMARHRLVVSDGFKCQHCRLVCCSGEVLAYHMRQKHNPLALDVFGCTFCAESFSTAEQMHAHEMETHAPETMSRRSSSLGFLSRAASSSAGVKSNRSSEFEEFTKGEYNSMRTKFFQRTRHRLADKVENIKTIQEFRAKHGLEDCRVSHLAEIFETQDKLDAIGFKNLTRFSDQMEQMIDQARVSDASL